MEETLLDRIQYAEKNLISRILYHLDEIHHIEASKMIVPYEEYNKHWYTIYTQEYKKLEFCPNIDYGWLYYIISCIKEKSYKVYMDSDDIDNMSDYMLDYRKEYGFVYISTPLCPKCPSHFSCRGEDIKRNYTMFIGRQPNYIRCREYKTMAERLIEFYKSVDFDIVILTVIYMIDNFDWFIGNYNGLKSFLSQYQQACNVSIFDFINEYDEEELLKVVKQHLVII